MVEGTYSDGCVSEAEDDCDHCGGGVRAGMGGGKLVVPPPNEEAYEAGLSVLFLIVPGLY